MTDRAAAPLEIRVRRASRRLEVDFAGGDSFSYPAEYLRVESPSAEVQGHSPEQRVTVPGKAEVGIRSVDPIGHYAVRIAFDDGHDTGIFTWAYLLQLGQEQLARWERYLGELAAKGLSRDPPARSRIALSPAASRARRSGSARAMQPSVGRSPAGRRAGKWPSPAPRSTGASFQPSTPTMS